MNETSTGDAVLAERFARRQELYERYPMVPTAFCTDGRQVGFVGPLDLGVALGGFAVVEHDGRSVIVHVHDLRLAVRDGSVSSNWSDEGGGSFDVDLGFALRHVEGTGSVIGVLGDGGFVPAERVSAFGERPVRPADVEVVRAVTDGLYRGADTIRVGSLHGFPGLPARLRSKGFSRHTFMCGQSGSGKTYTTGVLFERLLAHTSLPIVVIDPNSDHVHLGALAHPDDRSEEAELYRRVAPSVVVTRTRGLPSTVTLCADFSDLEPDARALLLRLDPIADLDEYAMLREVTERLDPPFSVADVAQAAAQDAPTSRIARRIENLGIDDWSVWRRDGERSATEVAIGEARCVIIDTGSLAGPDERAALSLAVLGNRWRRRHERRPTLLAIDEAHNVVPASTEHPLLRAAADLGVLIAGEGRKFGLHLFLASQRPGKVHPNVSSQCDNLVLMRMNGLDDIAALESAFSHVPPMLMRQSLGFGLGQALFAGPIAPLPLIAQVETRLTPEGGGDVPTTWTATPPHE